MSEKQHPPIPRPATVEEIVICAQKIWADPLFRNALEKVGVHGDLEEKVFDRLLAQIYAIGEAEFPDAASGHLVLAEPILRGLADGVYEGFEDPKIADFIRARRVKLIGRGWSPMRPPPMDVVIGWFRFFIADPEIREIGLRNKEIEWLSDEDDTRCGKRESMRMFKYGLQYTAGAEHLAFGMFRTLVSEPQRHFTDQELTERFLKTLRYRMAAKK